jgi:hypothetical protein
MLTTEIECLLAMDVKTQQAAIDQMIAGQTYCSRLRDTVAAHGDLPAQKWQDEGTCSNLSVQA